MNELIHIFAHTGLDRVSEKRSDKTWMAEMRRARATRYILLQKLEPLVRLNGEKSGALVTVAPGELEQFDLTGNSDPVLLGVEDDGGAWFAADVDPDMDLTAHGEVVDLRTAGWSQMLSPRELARAGHAKALIDWHARHRFCANCGAADESVRGGYMRHCAACGREHFPRVDPVVIMLPYREGKCLLGRSPRFLANMYSALAGFVEPGESIEEAVRREVREETNIEIGAVHYHSSQPWPFPSSLMIGCLCEALSEEITIDPVEIADARWFSQEEAVRIFERAHPEQITAPFAFAIAHHLLRSFIAAHGR